MADENYPIQDEQYSELWKRFDEAIYGTKPEEDSRRRELLSGVVQGLWILHDQGRIVEMGGIPRDGGINLNHIGNGSLNKLIQELSDSYFLDMEPSEDFTPSFLRLICGVKSH